MGLNKEELEIDFITYFSKLNHKTRLLKIKMFETIDSKLWKKKHELAQNPESQSA